LSIIFQILYSFVPYYISLISMYLFSSYLCFFTFGIGLLFCLYLFIQFRQFKATWFLIILFASLSFTEFYMYALGSRAILEMPFLFRFSFPFRILFGPMLFLFVRTMLQPEKKLRLLDSIHFFPSILLIGCLMPDFFASTDYKLNFFKNFYENNTVFITNPTGLIPAGWLAPIAINYGLFYCILSFIKIYKYKRIKAYQLPSNQVVISWISLVSWAVFGFIFCQLLQYLSLSKDHEFSVWTQIFQSISIISLKAYLLVSPNVIENMDGCIIPQNSPSKPLLPFPKSQYKDSAFVKEMDIYFSQFKPYLNSDFALANMAENLGISPKKLSNQIKLVYAMAFSELVNRYRIYYLLQLLQDQKGKLLKLEALIPLCGFQYRSSFYAAFKKIMNTTPSSYFKEHGLAGSIPTVN
jgi:AraC-like DNA-binding protein